MVMRQRHTVLLCLEESHQPDSSAISLMLLEKRNH